MPKPKKTSELSYYIGSKIRNLRIVQRYKQKDLAKFLKISTVLYHDYETAKIKTNIDILYKIAMFFRVKIDYFFVGYEDSMEKKANDAREKNKEKNDEYQRLKVEGNRQAEIEQIYGI